MIGYALCLIAAKVGRYLSINSYDGYAPVAINDY